MVDFVAESNFPDFDLCGKVFGSTGGTFKYQCIFCTEIHSFAADFERHVVEHLVKEYAFNEPVVSSVSPENHYEIAEPEHIELSIKAEPIHVEVDFNCFDDEGDSFDALEVAFN